MTIPASWRGNPATEPEGAFAVRMSLDLTTTWTGIDVRDAGFLARSDVLAALAAGGVTAAQAAASAVLRRLDVQNRDADDGVEISSRATAGGSSAPDPADAYNVAMVSGGAAVVRFATREEVYRAQLRTATGTGSANVQLRFDVPVE